MIESSANRDGYAVLTQLPAPEPWFACVLSAAYPVEQAAVVRYQKACAILLDRVPAFAFPSNQEVLLQFDRFYAARDVPRLQRNARAWMPEIGLGIWPHRGSPTLWSRQEFEDTPVGKLRPLMHKVFRIQPDPRAVASAWEEYLGSGVLVRCGVKDPSRFYQEAMDNFQPTITEPALKSFPLYAPLLEGAALKDASSDQLAQWLCGAEAYARESAEDEGLFLLCPMPGDSWFHDLARSSLKEEVHWQINRLTLGPHVPEHR